MKLQTIHEASYAGHHPIVTEIKQALENNEPVDIVINDKMKSQKAVQGIVKSFGEPNIDDEAGETDMSTKVMVWDFPGNRLQLIIQGDRTIVELYSKKKPTKFFLRMRRRQTR